MPLSPPQVRVQRELAERGRVAHPKADEDWMKSVRAAQRQARLAAGKRELIEVKGLLRYCPQDAGLRREAETLEAMYKGLLEEAR